MDVWNRDGDAGIADRADDAELVDLLELRHDGDDGDDGGYGGDDNIGDSGCGDELGAGVDYAELEHEPFDERELHAGSFSEHGYGAEQRDGFDGLRRLWAAFDEHVGVWGRDDV